MNDKDYYTNILKILEIDLEKATNTIDKDYLKIMIVNTSKRLKPLLFDD